MNALVRLGTVGAENWDTLAAAPSGNGYLVSETDGNFHHTGRNEAVLRFIGITIVFGSLIQWTLPDVNFVGDASTTKALMSIACALIGMAIYRFAIKGHRSQISYDPKKGELLVSALNRQDRQKGIRRIPLSRVKSIYVRRSDMPQGMAALRIRLQGNTSEITALRGRASEIEVLHGLLCRDIRTAKSKR